MPQGIVQPTVRFQTKFAEQLRTRKILPIKGDSLGGCMSRIEHFLEGAKAARDAAEEATNEAARDAHIMRAERYADEAWHLNEADPDSPPLPTSLLGLKALAA